MIITIALGVGLGIILGTIGLIALVSNPTVMTWYTKYIIKMMESFTKKLDEEF